MFKILQMLCLSFVLFGCSSINNVYVFTGRYSSDSMGDTASIVTPNYEDNYIIGISSRKDLVDLNYGFRFGGEVGLAGRFGDDSSREIWGGILGRHKGLTFNKINIAPALTFGLSYVDSLIGIEKDRARGKSTSANLLFYLSPELSFSLINKPQWEIVYRLHHRSGANRTLNNMCEGHNANTVGIRYNF